MVTRRRRRRATKQEQATQSQDDSHHMMPTLVKPSPPTNSGIMVLPSLSRDPHLVQAMQQCLSNHSILSRRCHRPKTKGYPRKLHKLLTVKPFQRRKEAGKMSPIDSRSWRKLNPSATGNPYISGRSGHSLKPFERSRGSSRSRHSSSFYPSTWQLEDDSIKKNEQIIDSKNSLEEIIHCACLNRTAYDHRLNTPLKTDTACQCRLKRSREKAIQMPSTRIRSRSSCKLKRLKQLISKHLFSVVAQQTQTSLKSNSHEGKVNGLCNPSLHRCRAYSGEEDNSKNANKKAAKFKNYGGYSPSETSFEDSHERPAEHLSRIEKISKPPRRRPSDPPRIQRENSGRHMDYDIQGPPWSLHLANVKEIERYTARSADWDYCDTVCPKRDICHCDYEDYYDDYDNDEDYNDNNENYNDYDNDGNKDEDGPAEEDGNPDGDGDADVIVENSEKNTDRQDRRQEVLSHDDDKSITTHEDFDDPEDAKVMEEKASVNEDSLVEIDDKKDEKKDSSDQRDSSKTKKWKNVGFCPDVTCNRKCGHCSKVQMETECDCENSVRGRNGEPPRYTNRGICKCCQCSRTPSFNRLNRENREFCSAAKCDRKCRRCREVMTQTSKEVFTKEVPSEQDKTSTSPKKRSTNLRSDKPSQLSSNNIHRESPRQTKSSRKSVLSDKHRSTDSQQSLDNGSNNSRKTDHDSPTKIESQSREGSQRSVDNRSTISRRSSKTDQSRVCVSPKKIESQSKEKSQQNTRNTIVTKTRRTPESRSKEGSQLLIDTKSPDSRDHKNRKSKMVEVEDDISLAKDREQNSSDDQSKRKERRRNSKSGEGLLKSSISRHGSPKENTSKLSTRESLEVPVNVENYASEDVKRDAPDKKHCGDLKCFRQCRPCSEAVTQTFFPPEFKVRCYCPCAEAVTQTSYRCLCCRRCGVALKRSRCGPCGPRRRDSGTEASTFSEKYSQISQHLPNKFCYCTENRKNFSKSSLDKFTNHSRRSSIDRRYRQSERLHFPNYPKGYHFGDKSCTPSHMQGECNYPSVAIGSQSDLKQIIDILHKAVNGLELQQNTKEQLPPRNGTKGGRDVPLSNQGSYTDYQQPQQPCSKDTCPQNLPLYATQVMQPHYCQDNRASPLNVQLYALNEYSKQQSIGHNLGKPIQKIQFEDQSLPLPNPKDSFSKFKDLRFNTQDRRSHDQNLSSSNPELKSHKFEDLNAERKSANDQYPLLHLTKLPGLMSFQKNTNVQGLPAKYLRHIEDINRKDRVSKQDRDSTYQSSAVDAQNYTKRQGSDPIIMPNGNANIQGQTLYYQGQILASTKPDIKGRRSSYPPLNQNYQTQISENSYQEHREERRSMPTRRSSGQAIQNHKDSSRFRVSEPIYQRDPSTLYDERKFNTSESLDETKPQLYSDGVQFTYPYGPFDPYNPTMQKCNRNPEYCQDQLEYKTKKDHEYSHNKSPCTHHLQAPYRVGFTDLKLPMDNKLRKSSGQSGAFLDDEQSQMKQMHLANGQRSNFNPTIQSKWSQTCTQINPLNGNSFLVKQQQFWPSKDNHTQKIQRGFLPNCEPHPGIEPIWPQPKKLLGRNSMIALNKSSFLMEPEENGILNCNCKNREDIPTAPVSRLKHHNSNAALSRLSSYDKHILRDFERSKEVPQPSSEETSSEPPECPCSDHSNESEQRKHSPACLCCGCMEELNREKENVHYEAEPKTSRVKFACCRMPKREKKEAPKQLEPKSGKQQEPRKVESKPSTGLFACCKKKKDDEKVEPKITKEKQKKETEKKPSRGIFSCCKKEEKAASKEVDSKPSKGPFSCCKRSKKEKKETHKDTEPKAKPSKNLFACCKTRKNEKGDKPKDTDLEPRSSKNLFACCKRRKKEKGYKPKDTDLKPRSSKNLFACCKRPIKEKEERSKDTEPKTKPSKNLFVCCKRPKKEKEETPKDAKPKSKSSKSLFSCCILSKKEKKETFNDGEPNQSRKEKKEKSNDVKSKRSCSLTSCWKGEKSNKEKPQAPPKPLKTEMTYDKSEEIECPCPKPRTYDKNEEMECPCPKPRQVKEVKVLFDSSSRFRDCSSEEEAICYNPLTRQIPEHERHNYVICDKLESPPTYTYCKPPTRSVKTYETTSSSTSCDCDSSADSSDENDDESQNANHFYTIFRPQNSNNTHCYCNSQRR